MERPARPVKGTAAPGTKLLFWLILGCLSNYLAEGISGAGMYPLIRPWWVLVCLPLYGLHLVVLAHIVLRHGKLRFSALLLAGFIFGLYEAYMRKIVWQPDWGDAIVSIGGIAVVETAVISFFWHPILAFVIPIVVGETILTSSRESWNFLPRPVQLLFRDGPGGRLSLALLAAAAGAFQSYNSRSPGESLGSGVSSFGIIALLVYLWLRKHNAWKMRDMLLEPITFRILTGLLLTMYVVFGFFHRTDALPGLGPQAIVWTIYAIVILLLIINLRDSAEKPVPAGLPPPRFAWGAFLAVALSVTLTSAGLNLIPGKHDLVILGTFWGLGGVGAFLFLFAAVDTIRRPRPGVSRTS